MKVIWMFSAVASAFAVALSLFTLVLPSSSASVDPGDVASGGSISWMLVSSTLVLLMVPGITLFYGGLLRKQSMSAMISQSMAGAAVVGLLWVVCGYSLTFGGDGVFGDLSRMFFEGAVETASGGEVSELEFAIYEMMFAIIASCLILGSCAERLRFPAACLFLALWSILVYAPLAHWVWDGGFKAVLGDWFCGLDFAGGVVIHTSAALAGVAVVRFLGPRKECIRRARAHSIPLMFIGTAFLLVGWMGFNGGSFFCAGSGAVHAIATTMVSWVTSAVVWVVLQYNMSGKVNSMGICTGVLAGLVAVTPCAGYVSIPVAMAFGACGSLIGYFAIRYFHNLATFDDALDVFALHGCVTVFSVVALGVVADPAVVGEAARGLVYGGVNLFLSQVFMEVFAVVYSFLISYAIIWVLSRFIRVGVSPEEQNMGQDIVEHGEPAYY